MRWYLDTHKFMSEITRTALQVMVQYGVTSESDAQLIDRTEKALADAGVYKDYNGSNGRIRRALFTYFRAYNCLDEHEQLTEIGRLFVENKISVKEFCFHYIVNFVFRDGQISYFPVQLLLTCLKKLAAINTAEAYITAYDFSKIVECDYVEQIDDDFISGLVNARQGEPISVNERSIGSDVWGNILISAGILKKTFDKKYVLANKELADWILAAYENCGRVNPTSVLSGILYSLPLPTLSNPHGDATPYLDESKSLQAFLFDDIEKRIIEKYVYKSADYPFSDMLSTLGLTEANRGFWRTFDGYERLVGYALSEYDNHNYKVIGSILSNILPPFTEMEEQNEFESFDGVTGGENILYYGVPGAGKSYTIKQIIGESTLVERTVFHPDYSYSDFVGQVLPTVEKTPDGGDKLRYKFVPGPFTRVLKTAKNNPDKMCYLVIEEINRGNAPAIFGDVFQLLDRNSEGVSEYGISNSEIAEEVYGNSVEKVFLPSNVSIFATMNTSDQNVFTLDTAFQRRWKMRQIPNNVAGAEHAESKIEGSDVTWGVFASVINDAVIKANSDMVSSEDKRLGAYFIRPEELSARRFSEKALKYLWDDAFRMNRDYIFNSDMQTLEQVIEVYQNSPVDKLQSVLRLGIYKEMLEKVQQSENEKNDDQE